MFVQGHMPNIIAGAGSIETSELTPDEEKLFDDALLRLARLYGIVGDMAALYDLLKDWRTEFLECCRVAKHRFDMAFGGSAPGGSQFGMSFIRPKVFGTAYETAYWWKTITAAGWQDVWGSSGTQITMPDTSGSRALIAFPMVMSGAASPKLHELWIHVEGTNYPICPIKPWCRVGDVYVATLPGCVAVGPGSSFHMRGNFDQVGNEEIIPLGVQFSIAAYMRTE